jgi:hypothetical protein
MTGWSILAQRALARAMVRFMRYPAMLTPRGKVTSYVHQTAEASRLLLYCGAAMGL